jgi:hypothetical protein
MKPHPEQRDKGRGRSIVILEDLKIRIQFMPRDEAERLHRCRLYQRRRPSKVIRVVEIMAWTLRLAGPARQDHFVRGANRIRRTKRIRTASWIEYSSG